MSNDASASQRFFEVMDAPMTVTSPDRPRSAGSPTRGRLEFTGARGRTAVIIAHRLSTVAIADRVLVLEHGRIVQDGSPDDPIDGSGAYAALHAAWCESLV